MVEAQRPLEALIRRSLPDGPWFERALDSAALPFSSAFRAAYASVPRRLGAERERALDLDSDPLADQARSHWTLGDWTRAALLTRALGTLDATEHSVLVIRLFERGEIGEQESLLRTLSLLPRPERYLDTALLACRSNARRVFEAIACENAYPAQHIPESGFNQLVLKAIFLELPTARIDGLERRITSELTRMLGAYASERRAAGRSVPDDIAWIVERAPRSSARPR